MKGILALIAIIALGCIVAYPIVWAGSWAAELWTRLIGGGKS